MWFRAMASSPLCPFPNDLESPTNSAPPGHRGLHGGHDGEIWCLRQKGQQLPGPVEGP